MPAPILATKLYIPSPRPDVVSRPRLIAQLGAGLCQNRIFGRKLTLISAPAGFGKTTLISEWLVGLRHTKPLFRVAWLSLDEGDNDLSRFLVYLVAALQTIAKDIGAGLLQAIQSQPLVALPEFLLTSLLNEIATLPDHVILVLDDYHAISSESIDRALTFLLDHLPPQIHIVLTTRADPALPLSRYRVRAQLTELRAADLRFTPEEAGAFLNRIMNLNLSPENIANLEARTEGWIAGLQLAALSLQGRPDSDRFIRDFTGSHRFVLDYLVAEVLQRQPEPVRGFLLQTALLDQLCAPLCNAVTEREDGKEMLDALERSNLFLIPLDDQRRWYRYHHLFADVLQAHLLTAQPDQIAALHGRASGWYEQNGLRSAAIRHALAAKDFERAAGLIERTWPAAEEGSIPPTAWLNWVRALPEVLLRTRPVLNLGYAYALLGNGEMEAAETRLKAAERCLEPAGPMVVVDQEQFKSLPAAIAIGHAYIAQASGNIPDTVRYARQALDLPEANSFRHGQAAMLLGMTCWANGDLEVANRVFADYTLKLRAAANLRDAISTTVVLTEIRLALGRLREAIRTSEQLLQFVIAQGEPIVPDIADLHRELGELYLEQGNLEAAAQHLQKSKQLGEKAELPVWRYRWCIAQARLKETQGDMDGALALLDQAQRLYIRTPLPNVHPISALKARIWVRQGRLPQALGWVREQGLSPDDDLCYLREFEHLTLAQILIAQYQNDHTQSTIHTALRLLDRLLQAAEKGRRMGSVIAILVSQARAHQAQGNLPSARAPLERAVALAEPEGYVRIFVAEGCDPSNPVPAEKNSSSHPTKQAVNRQPLIEPLSERELEVLKLLRGELSGPEIARELNVSLSTLRTHTQNIYAKLGVNHRRAAVRRAEELDLL
jgi:LuxR family maltose regulon positive regulatory protein